MAKIRVDQSHCNHHLAKHLSNSGWTVIFKDAGRVSRGGSGLQGAMLRVFVEDSLPIPDIVAYLDGKLLAIEIDSTYSKVFKSLKRYRENQLKILSKTSDIISPETPVNTLLLSYCKMGETNPNGAEKLMTNLPKEMVNYFIIFDSPRSPMILENTQ